MVDLIWSQTIPFTVPAEIGALGSLIDLTADGLPPASPTGLYDAGSAVTPNTTVAVPLTTRPTDLDMDIQINEAVNSGNFVEVLWLGLGSDFLLVSPNGGLEIIEFSNGRHPGSITHLDALSSEAVYWTIFLNNGDNIQHTGVVTLDFTYSPNNILGTFLFGMGAGIVLAARRKRSRGRVMVIG